MCFVLIFSPSLFLSCLFHFTSMLFSFVQVSKLKRDLACMRQELLYKEQGFETLKE